VSPFDRPRCPIFRDMSAIVHQIFIDVSVIVAQFFIHVSSIVGRFFKDVSTIVRVEVLRYLGEYCLQPFCQGQVQAVTDV